MHKKAFVDKLQQNKGKELKIEVEGEIIQKITLQNNICEIIQDQLYIRNGINLDFAVINLNTIRDIQKDNNEIFIYLDDYKETTIKICVL